MKQLEDILKRFFESSSSIEKKQLESWIVELKKQDGILSQAELWLHQSSSEYLIWFGLSIFEDKLSLKDFLMDLLKMKYGVYSAHLSNKVVKLLIDVAKHSIPHEWSDFLGDLQSLSAISFVLYLKAIQTLIEEFSSTMSDVVFTRKNALKHFLAVNRAGFWGIASGILSNKISAFAHGDSGAIGINLQSPSKPEFMSHTPRIALGASPIQASGMEAHSSSSKQKFIHENSVIKQALLLISAMIPITPVSEPGLPQSIQSLFELSLVTNENGVLALSCVIDLSTKVQVPKGFESYSLFLGTHVMKLLEMCSQKHIELSQSYLDKIFELTHSFVVYHYARVQADPSFSPQTFLHLVYHATMLPLCCDSFILLMLVWEAWLDLHVAAVAENPGLKQQYENVLQTVSEALLGKLLMSSNAAVLESLDETSSDEELESELDHYISIGLNQLARIGDLHPASTIVKVVPLIQQASQAGNALFQDLKQLQDLRTIVMYIGRLAPIFSQYFQTYQVVTETLVSSLVNLITQSLNQAKLYPINAVTNLMVSLHGSMGLFVHWIVAYQTFALANPEYEAHYQALITFLVELCLTSMDSSSKEISIAGSSLLLSIARTVRPAMFQLTSVKSFLSSLHSRSFSNLQSKLNAYKSATMIFTVCRSGKMTDNEVSHRTSLCLSFFDALIGSLEKQVLNTPNSQFEVVASSLESIACCMDTVAVEDSSAKEILYQSIKRVIPAILSVGHTTLHPFVLPAYISFYLSCVRSLKRQMARYLKPQLFHGIRDCLSLFNDGIFETLIIAESGKEIYERLLELILCLVLDNTKAFDDILPDLISACDTKIQSKLLSNQLPELQELRSQFYGLISHILFNNWKYFFGGNLKSKMDSKSIESQRAPHYDMFLRLIQIQVKSFQETNSDVLKQSLGFLSELNERFFFYSKPFFTEVLLSSFLELFVDVLLSGAHDTLRENILTEMVKMMLVDVEKSRNQIIPLIFSKRSLPLVLHESLSPLLASVSDEESCAEYITAFINDAALFLRSV